jgi:hypothetical protein
MKRLSYWLIIIAVLLTAGCHERYDRSRSMVTCFWTSSAPQTKHHLYVNGKDKGVIPYSLTVPRTEERNRVLALNMRSGRFRLEVKDERGHTVYKERYRLRLSRSGRTIQSSGDDDRGGSKLHSRGKIVLKEIYFDE